MTLQDGDELRDCRECGREFILTRDEQRFFIERDLSKPSRCLSCRQSARKAHRAQEVR